MAIKVFVRAARLPFFEATGPACAVHEGWPIFSGISSTSDPELWLSVADVAASEIPQSTFFPLRDLRPAVVTSTSDPEPYPELPSVSNFCPGCASFAVESPVIDLL